jgi:cytochrome c-type biogenesis protein CcmH/NrfF
VGRYGEWILLEPEASGFNLAVYVLPVAAVLAGAALIVIATRRWLARSAAAPPDTRDLPDAERDPEFEPWEQR